MLIQYVRKGKRPVGCLVAIKRDGDIVIAYSLCRKEDNFTKHRAKQIALGRAMSWTERRHRRDILPRSLYRPMEEFTKRAERYYKLHREEMICYG